MLLKFAIMHLPHRRIMCQNSDGTTATDILKFQGGTLFIYSLNLFAIKRTIFRPSLKSIPKVCITQSSIQFQVKLNFHVYFALSRVFSVAGISTLIGTTNNHVQNPDLHATDHTPRSCQAWIIYPDSIDNRTRILAEILRFAELNWFFHGRGNVGFVVAKPTFTGRYEEVGRLWLIASSSWCLVPFGAWFHLQPSREGEEEGGRAIVRNISHRKIWIGYNVPAVEL